MNQHKRPAFLFCVAWIFAATASALDSRKLMQHRIDPGMLDEVAMDFSLAAEQDLPTVDSFLKRRGDKAVPPPPPSPARYEMCQGIPFKRYKFVKSMGEMREALSSAKPGDLIEVKSGIYYQGSGPGSSSLISPLLGVEERGSAVSPRIDPRNKDKPPVHSLLGAQMVTAPDGLPVPTPPRDVHDLTADELADMSFAELYELYSSILDEHEQDLVAEALDAFPAPAPAPAPGKPPKRPTGGSGTQETTNVPGTKRPGKNPSKRPGGKRPIFSGLDTLAGGDGAAAPPANQPGNKKPKPQKPKFDVYEIDEDRFESYYSDDEADNLPEDVKPPRPAPGQDKPKPSRTQGWITPSGTIDDVHGTIDDPITLCGPKTAVFDGSNGNGGLAAAALRVVRSSNVRVVGFTLQNALKGLDVQMTNASTFSNITTRYTLQEGIRLRYNSTYNTVFGCNITFTGRLWAGIGEGLYVGTSTRNSIASGRPEDQSNFNVITFNTFGEGIPAENIDLKEYTSGGLVANNTFNGSGIAGLNGAIAWVAVKGRGYTIANNTGSGTLPGGQGIRVLQVLIADNEQNTVIGNECNDFEAGSYCVFIDSRAKNTTVDCGNKRFVSVNATQRSTKRTCNCNIDDWCSDGTSSSMTIKSAKSGGSHGFMAASYQLLPRNRVEDQWEFRRDWD